jgi:cytochrome c peroxidase
MKSETVFAGKMITSGVKTIVCLAFLCTARIASAASADEDLLKQANRVFGPLPQVMTSEQNPVTPEKVKLGKLLFFEPRISIDGTISCAKCHPISLYAADGLRKAVGNNCRPNPRNSPTIFNAAEQISAHWIGNRTNVEDQARQSVTGPPAFGMPSNEAVEKKLKESKEYRMMFKEAFPGDKNPVTVDNLAKAVGAYERTLVTPAPFDAYVKGDINALTGQQKRGLKAFIDGGCSTCHFSAYFGGRVYQKFGVWEPYWKYTKSEPVDEGRYVVTKNDADKYVFKVPVLRNVEKTPPYFHDGSVDKLGDAVTIMAKIQTGKDLTKKQVDDISAFLGSLTGDIPDDAAKVPVLPAME